MINIDKYINSKKYLVDEIELIHELIRDLQTAMNYVAHNFINPVNRRELDWCLTKIEFNAAMLRHWAKETNLSL